MPLRDYPQDAWSRSGQPTAANGRSPVGPLVSPLRRPNCDVPKTPEETSKDISCIQRNTDDLTTLISMLVDMLTPNNPPKGAIPLRVWGQAAVSAVAQTGAGTQLVSTNVLEGYAGYVTLVQCKVDPEAANSDVQFSLRINNKTVPNFDQYVNVENTSVPLNVFIPPMASVQLFAKNVGTGGLLANGCVIGWLAPVRRY